MLGRVLETLTSACCTGVFRVDGVFSLHLVGNMSVRCDLNSHQLPRVQEKYAEAEQLLRRSLAINTEVYGPDNLEVAADLFFLGLILETMVSPTFQYH